jgi:hypothetical protein
MAAPMHAIDDLHKKLVGQRVACKLNAKGERVVALVFSSFKQR